MSELQRPLPRPARSSTRARFQGEPEARPAMAFSVSVALLCMRQSTPELAPTSAPLPSLAAPVKVMAGGKPIAADSGHAAPLVHDVDGDGLGDLLVGQFGGGTCRVYRNVGTRQEPRFDSFELLKAGGAPAAMNPG